MTNMYNVKKFTNESKKRESVSFRSGKRKSLIELAYEIIACALCSVALILTGWAGLIVIDRLLLLLSV